MVSLRCIGGWYCCFSAIAEIIGLGRIPGHSFLLDLLFSLSSFFFTPRASPVVAAVVWVLPQAQPSQSTELRLSGHRPGPSMGQKLLVFTGVGKAPLHQVTHWLKSQALGLISVLGTCPNPSTHPASQGTATSGHVSVLPHPQIFSSALMTPDSTNPLLISSISSSYRHKNEHLWKLHNHPHQSRVGRGRCIPFFSCGDKTGPTVQQCQDTAQSHCLC